LAVQNFPSLQNVPSAAATMAQVPVKGAQTLCAHAVSLLVSQETIVVGSTTQAPPLQTSVPLHLSPFS
jgi:hypothetical protein